MKHPDYSFVGPPLDAGPLPALFYFALSKEESLTLDPYNQPVNFMKSDGVRIFSLTIPGHGPNLDPKKAIDLWEESYGRGEDPLTPFFKSCAETIKSLKPSITKLAVAGLSRGAFVACHVATLVPELSHIIGYAPLTQLNFAPHLNLDTLLDKLYNRSVRFYIGNRDRRVGTDKAFDFIHKLADVAYENRIRSAPHEMIIGPSIGYMGHGTPPEVFKAGTDFLKSEWSL